MLIVAAATNGQVTPFQIAMETAMVIAYSITSHALNLIELKVDGLGIADFNSHYFPAIMWALGGTSPEGAITPHYSLVWIKKEDLSRMVAIKIPKYGFIGLRPSPEDALTDRTILDYDGKTLFLR
ncbi:MAG: hypothetical protein EBY21_02625 [Alphaproteobacteria bacterium]|nr:hypothetical protein [Alphaproteobacteria bacterium]